MTRRMAGCLALVLAAGLAGCGGVGDPLAAPDGTRSSSPLTAPPVPEVTTAPKVPTSAASARPLDPESCSPGGGARDTIRPDPTFYPGPEASAAYELTFAQGPDVPHLDTHTPQGLTLWSDWDGEGNDLLLLGAYRDGEPSYLIGIDPGTGEHVGTVAAPESHLGALGVVGDWLIAQHRDAAAVRTYRIEDLREAMREAVDSGTEPELRPTGGVQELPAANFMSSHDGRAWIGDYAGDADGARMYEYEIDADGRLDQVGEPWPVPARTQGALVTDDRFVFVSGLRSGTMTVVDRAAVETGADTLAGAPGRCFVSPSHGQNIVRHGDTVYLAFEGGSARYADEGTTPNPITNLHLADYHVLASLTDPPPR